MSEITKKFKLDVTKEKTVWEEAEIEVEITLDEEDFDNKQYVEFMIREEIRENDLLQNVDLWYPKDEQEVDFETSYVKEIK